MISFISDFPFLLEKGPDFVRATPVSAGPIQPSIEGSYSIRVTFQRCATRQQEFDERRMSGVRRQRKGRVSKFVPPLQIGTSLDEERSDACVAFHRSSH